jgi:fatty acid desaturase
MNVHSAGRGTAAPRRAADVLTREEIKAFTRTSDIAGLRAVIFTWGVIAASFVLLARLPHPAVFVTVVVVLGGRQLALAVMMHEAAHGTLFRTRFFNDAIVDALCARPVWTDVARYRKHHLAHHAHTGTERDPDLGLATPFPVTRASLVRKLLRDVVGISGIKRVIGLIAMDLELVTYDVGAGPKRLPWRSLRHHLRAGARNLLPPAIANGVLFGILAVLGYAWIFSAWAVAFLTTYGLFLRVRSIAEHAGLGGPNPFTNTRTTHASLLARLTVSPLNVGYHLEHHLLPTVPYYRLPAMHRVLLDRDAVPEASLAPSYVAVLAQLGNKAV